LGSSHIHCHKEYFRKKYGLRILTLHKAWVFPCKMIRQFPLILHEMRAHFSCLSNHGAPITYKQTHPRNILINYRAFQQHSISESFIAFSSVFFFLFLSWDETQLGAAHINTVTLIKPFAISTLSYKRLPLFGWILLLIYHSSSFSLLR
jgi:hypothetical protein